MFLVEKRDFIKKDFFRLICRQYKFVCAPQAASRRRKEQNYKYQASSPAPNPMKKMYNLFCVFYEWKDISETKDIGYEQDNKNEYGSTNHSPNPITASRKLIKNIA